MNVQQKAKELTKKMTAIERASPQKCCRLVIPCGTSEDLGEALNLSYVFYPSGELFLVSLDSIEGTNAIHMSMQQFSHLAWTQFMDAIRPLQNASTGYVIAAVRPTETVPGHFTTKKREDFPAGKVLFQLCCGYSVIALNKDLVNNIIAKEDRIKQLFVQGLEPGKECVCHTFPKAHGGPCPSAIIAEDFELGGNPKVEPVAKSTNAEPDNISAETTATNAESDNISTETTTTFAANDSAEDFTFSYANTKPIAAVAADPGCLFDIFG